VAGKRGIGKRPVEVPDGRSMDEKRTFEELALPLVNAAALIACDLVLVGRFGTNSRVEKSARQARRSDPMGVY